VLVPASVLLIRPFQLLGLVIGRYLSVSAFVFVSILISQRVFRLPQRWGKVIALMVVSVACAGLGQYVVLPNPWLEAIARTPLWLACAAAPM